MKEIIEVTSIGESKNILEVGCGPGTFTRKLKKELSEEIKITGLDMDGKFIEYCREIGEKEGLENINYIEGDALSLPFENNTFDVCISHTVIEHVPNREFLKEQYRVCKEGGYVSVLNVRPESSLMSEDNIKPTEREKELMRKIGTYTKEVKNELQVGEFFDNPQNILKLFQKIGFKEIQLDALTYVNCTDDDRNSNERKRLMIDYEYNIILEFIRMNSSMKKDILTNDEEEELIGLINDRYKERLKLLDNGERLWDFSISPMIVISGMK